MRTVKTILNPIFGWLFISFIGTCLTAQQTTEQTAKLEFFESKIRPILVEQCYRCHSTKSGKSKGSLLLDSATGWKAGGDSGPAIVPGKPDESPLFAAISRNGDAAEMPPTSHLSEQVIGDFKKWILDGAIDPRASAAPIKAAKKIDIEAGKKFWAFQPRRPSEANDSIDKFVRPSAPVAHSDKLVRRIFLDLIGLPPTPEERESFAQMYSQQSPQKAVRHFADQLLKRKQFGEKWARHWLDVARYADSNGGDFNLTFQESWRYRNYIIDAFNQDMPYDQFLREQIAGDLLPADSVKQRNRQLVATGFLMVSPKMLTERDKSKMRLDIADEQVDTIGRATMGLTLGCARCHDHKFDPIPTADYYAITGILHSTLTADRVLMNNVNVTGWTNTKMAIDEVTKAKIESNTADIQKLETEIATLKKRAAESPSGIVVDDPKAIKKGTWRKSTYRSNHVGKHYLAANTGSAPCSITWKAKLPKPGKYELRVSFCGGSGLAKRASYLVRHSGGEKKITVDQTATPSINGLWSAIGQFSLETVAEVHLTNEKAGGHVIADAIQWVLVDELEKSSITEEPSPLVQLKSLQKKLAKLKSETPKIPHAMAAQDNSLDLVGDLNIRIRGEARNLGPKVPRGFLQVASYSESSDATIPQDQSGRIQLANWIAHPNHPLTARVMANRIWQHLFGRGIVATSDNFGVRGTAPSHPELLDFLAEKLIANGWSIKSLIREIVQSKTYQQSAMAGSDEDPDNIRLQHQNRRALPVESIRDSILAIAGQLDTTPRESVVSKLGMYAIETGGKRHKSLGETGKLRCRSIYMPIVRGAVPPSLAIFDLPNPDLVTGRRDVTTVPTQALFMMNSPFVRQMASETTVQTKSKDRSIEATIKKLYSRILIREADEEDIAMAKGYIESLIGDGKTEPESIASFVQVLFSSAEFRFIE